MKKLVFVMALVSTGFAQADWEHVDHGVVKSNHKAYKSALKACNAEIYKDGIMIDGNLETKAKKIKMYEDRYFKFRVKSTMNNILYINVPDDKLKGEYAEAERILRARKSCLESAGWKRAKAES